ncbi:MAG: cyclic nucleotide-binding domain-containing protein [Pseudomonadota bacterium]
MMCIRDETKALSMTPLLKGIEPSKLRCLAFASDRIIFEDGESIIEQGEDADVGFVVMNGEAEMTVDTPKGGESLGTVGLGHLIGEAAMLAGTPYFISVSAKGPVEALCIRKEHLLKLLEGCADSTSIALQSLSKRIADVEARQNEAVG